MDFTSKQEPPPGTPLPYLMRQGSIYSLTFDEFQSTLGGGSKDFGSMNMDELLKSIYSAEETQATIAAPSVSNQQNSLSFPRQGSLSLPRTISHKTVDTVWKDIVYTGQCSGSGAGTSGTAAVQEPRPPTLGEMTLQEFLIRAGVIGEGEEQPPPLPAPPPPPVASFANPQSVFENDFGKIRPFGVMGLGYDPVDSPVDLSPVPVPYVFKGGVKGRKGAAVEKVVERRHRRMIKNRESAARSRARKQAYMMELEDEVAKLKEHNEKLQKTQTEMMVLQKTRLREQLNQQNRAKKLCLRRTFTGPW